MRPFYLLSIRPQLVWESSLSFDVPFFPLLAQDYSLYFLLPLQKKVAKKSRADFDAEAAFG